MTVSLVIELCYVCYTPIDSYMPLIPQHKIF